MGPRVSVIIATYNRVGFIKDAVQSVLDQTFQDLEVIVVDDGSTDGTGELFATIPDERVRYFYQANRGRSNARNEALRRARGEYIAFLDSDDIYLPDKIGMQVDYLDSHPETGMIYTSAYCIDDAGRLLRHVYKAIHSGDLYRDIAFFRPVTITLPTVMVRREVLDRAGDFDEGMERFEDTDMWRRISKICRIDAISEFTCKLRTHRGNALKSQDPEQIRQALDYYAAKVMSEDRDVALTVRRKGLSRLYAYYAEAIRAVPEWDVIGRDLLRRSFSYWPLRRAYFLGHVFRVALRRLLAR